MGLGGVWLFQRTGQAYVPIFVGFALSVQYNQAFCVHFCKRVVFFLAGVLFMLRLYAKG